MAAAAISTLTRETTPRASPAKTLTPTKSKTDRELVLTDAMQATGFVRGRMHHELRTFVDGY